MSERGRDSRALRAGLLWAGALLALPGCYTTQLMRIQQGLDSLRVVADSAQVRDSTIMADIAQTRRDIDEQRDLLMGTRASTGTVSREIFDTLARLEAKVDDLAARLTSRSSPGSGGPSPGTPSGVTADALYDQAAMDLTQGRYGAALREFRDFMAQFPNHDLADNARFGVGECFFAQAQYDSAAAEYAALEHDSPTSDKVPAALYKLALCYERQGKKDKSQDTLQALVKRYPNSGEAQLARERLGKTR
jgi:tol-pal system protein YbgF